MNGLFLKNMGFVSKPDLLKQKQVIEQHYLPLFCRFKQTQRVGIYTSDGRYNVVSKNKGKEYLLNWLNLQRKLKIYDIFLNKLKEIPDIDQAHWQSAAEASNCWHLAGLNGIMSLWDEEMQCVDGYCVCHGRASCVEKNIFSSDHSSCVSPGNDVLDSMIKMTTFDITIRDIETLGYFNCDYVIPDPGLILESVISAMMERHGLDRESVLKQIDLKFDDDDEKESKENSNDNINSGLNRRNVVYTVSPYEVLNNGAPKDGTVKEFNALIPNDIRLVHPENSGYKSGMCEDGLKGAKYALIDPAMGLECVATRVGYNSFECCSNYGYLKFDFLSNTYDDSNDNNVKGMKEKLDIVFGKDFQRFCGRYYHCLYPADYAHLYLFYICEINRNNSNNNNNNNHNNDNNNNNNNINTICLFYQCTCCHMRETVYNYITKQNVNTMSVMKQIAMTDSTGKANNIVVNVPPHWDCLKKVLYLLTGISFSCPSRYHEWLQNKYESKLAQRKLQLQQQQQRTFWDDLNSKTDEEIATMQAINALIDSDSCDENNTNDKDKETKNENGKEKEKDKEKEQVQPQRDLDNTDAFMGLSYF